jgi:hypothetical protein
LSKTEVIHLWLLQIENPINWQKIKIWLRQSDSLTGFERLGNLKPFLVQNKVLAKI